MAKPKIYPEASKNIYAYLEKKDGDQKSILKLIRQNINATDAQKMDYVEWLVTAKQEATRDKIMSQAIEWIVKGKTRNWKYMKC